jgi:metal-sulfur cluster biosynthetic enzyme
VLTPTYSGCPATEAIEHDVLAAIEQAGLGRARATLRRAPAWTSDWISEDGRAKLKAYGIAPPAHLTPEAAANTRHADQALRAHGRRAHRLPALRQRAHRTAVGLRLHGLQGAVPLHGLPRAFRTLQADLTTQRIRKRCLAPR